LSEVHSINSPYHGIPYCVLLGRMSLRSIPRTILCVGRNYAEHAKELGNPQPLGEPFFFLKPASSLVFPPGPIRLPKGAEVHYEVELGVVIGSPASRLKSDKEAMSVIGGYVVAIDLTARNWQNEAKSKGLPWTKAKGCDTFLACGPFVNASLVPDPDSVTIRLLVNGVEKQRDTTANMIHKVPKLLQYATSCMSLQPGDLLLTGTPKGVGPLKVGDKVTIEGLDTRAHFDVADWQ